MITDAEIQNEAELESILVKNPSQIEEDFLVLTNQKQARGRLDILGIDSSNTLTIVELKVNSDPDQLRQIIQYYDWVLEQGIDWFNDAYKHKLGERRIIDEMPQLFLIAGEFHEETVILSKYLREDIGIKLFKYLALECENKKYIKLIDIDVPIVKDIEEKPRTIENNISYIDDHSVRALFSEMISNINSLDSDIEAKPAKRRISFFIHGRRFCAIYPKKKFFKVRLKISINDSIDHDVLSNINSKKLANEAFDKINDSYQLMQGLAD